MALGSVIAVLAIAPRDIDDKAARGLSEKAGAVQSSLGVLFTCKPLIGLAATLACFIWPTARCFHCLAGRWLRAAPAIQAPSLRQP
jgi:hypothetical protein